jgi:hypothetical protein
MILLNTFQRGNENLFLVQNLFGSILLRLMSGFLLFKASFVFLVRLFQLSRSCALENIS